MMVPTAMGIPTVMAPESFCDKKGFVKGDQGNESKIQDQFQDGQYNGYR